MIAIAMRAGHSKFYSYAGGIINDTDLCNTTAVDHAVVMLAYHDAGGNGDYFTVRNSWGSGWGDGGYFKVAKECVMGIYSYSSSMAVF